MMQRQGKCRAAAVPRRVSCALTLLAGGFTGACTSNTAPVLKEGEKPVDVAAVVRQKMPASVKDRDRMGAGDCQNLRKSRSWRRRKASCSVLRSRSRSNYQSDPVVPGLSKIAWQEIDRRAEDYISLCIRR